jgi:signal transduction histidine kinase
MYGVEPALVEKLQGKLRRPGPNTAAGRLMRTKTAVHIADVRTEPSFFDTPPGFTGPQLAMHAGARTLLAVPMLKESELVGYIIIYRQEPEPFVKKHIELVTNFAAQAVIAIDNTRLLSELRETLQQQTATADVLKVISRSAFDLQAVLDTLVQSAARLCRADRAAIRLAKDGVYHYVASYGFTPEQKEYARNRPLKPDRTWVAGRAVIEGKVVQVADQNADPNLVWRSTSAGSAFANARTVLGVPLLREAMPIGGLVLTRSVVEPFTEKQVELVTTFADQAVIAIENVRLFEAEQERTAELRESLQQQTATADVLKVISRSTFDLQVVLNTLIESAVRLCAADMGSINRQSGEFYRQVANFGHPQELDAFMAGHPLEMTRGTIVGRAILEGGTVHVPDVQADPEYTFVEGARIAGLHTMLGVPLLREGTPIGVIVLQRRSARPFTDKQIELVSTFADQAAIAIENVRLFDEIREQSHRLAEASQHKSRFLAAASHDLRQPMQALGLFVAQLRSHMSSAAGSRLVDRIDDAVAGMNELFNALLDVSKLDAGALTPTIAQFPIAELLGRIGSTFAAVAQEKGLSLRLVSSSAWLRSDPVLLERIVLNLVSNAVRYTTSGGIVVGCRHRGAVLRIEVADSGPGIPEDQRRKIFSEFYRLADAKKTNQAGLGLGLAIVERLCALLDHPIDLASTPGKGSRFSITVPTAPAAPLPKSEPSPAPAFDIARGKLVVVIDNDARVLEGMGGLLRDWGCRVVTATTPEAAVMDVSRIGHEARPDLIISDYHLNDGQSGITAIAKLREAYGPVPAFVMSGDTAPERLREARESGHHLLHKPVQPMKLRAMVSQFVTTSESA